MAGQQLSDLQRIALKIRFLGKCMINEGLTNYGLSLQQYADMIEKVIR